MDFMTRLDGRQRRAAAMGTVRVVAVVVGLVVVLAGCAVRGEGGVGQ